MAELVPIEDVARRVLRGIRTLGVLRDPERDWLRVKACWPATLVEWSDLLARAENKDLDDRPARFEPTRFDLGDYLNALAWWARMDPPSVPRGKDGLTNDQRIVFMVAFEWSFKSIGQLREYGQHEDTIRRRYRKAIARCADLANADARLEARNRAEQLFRDQARPKAGSGAPGRR